jgi:hypothetical protein
MTKQQTITFRRIHSVLQRKPHSCALPAEKLA